MNLLFLAATLTMSLIALSILVRPLVAGVPAKSKGNARLPLLIVIGSILLAVGLYGVIGSPDIAASSLRASVSSADPGSAQPAAQKTDGIAPVSSLVAGLEERLKNEPDVAKGWLLLAKTYQHLGRIDEASTAFEKAESLGQTDATLAKSLAADSGSVGSVAEIRGRINLSDAASELFNDGDTVFVFAKAVDGPAMPLAVIRRPVTDLPFEFVLSDEQSMVKGSGLSSVDEVIVTAKITASKDALNSAPALEARSDPITTTDSPYLRLTIGPAAINNNE